MMKNNFLKNKLTIFFLFIIILSVFSLVYSLLIYYNKLKIDNNSFKIISFIIGIVSFLILGFISGIICKENGLINGLLNALIVILLSLLVNFFINNNFNISNFIKISAYLISSSVGGIIGVNILPKKHGI